MKQVMLPAISDYKALEKFIKTGLEYCVVMNFSLIQLKQVCALLKEHNKKCFVHLDLIKGIANNEFGAEYIIETFAVDGIISTHPSVLEIAKQKKVKTVLRIFIIDSLALNKSLSIAKKYQPDYIEILPAFSYELKERIDKEVSIPLIGGGLVSTVEMVDRCLAGGLVAVTCSEAGLWKQYDVKND